MAAERSVLKTMRTRESLRRRLGTVTSTLLIAVAMIATSSTPAGADEATDSTTPQFRVIVRDDVSPGEAPTFEVVTVDLGGMFNLMSNASVGSVELDGYGEIFWQPTDPDYPAQWEHQVTGIETAWDTTRGSAEVVIAVLDSGVTPHAEFSDRLLPGTSFTGGNPEIDLLGHGTAVASVAAAGADNGVGIAGACPNCSILPVQIAGENGSVLWSAAASGIIWAVDQGADIINLSFGGQSNSSLLTAAVEYARSRNVIVVASAGNYGTDTPVYPANIDGVISTAAHDDTFTRYGWSSYGQWADLAAPGCTQGLQAGSIRSVCGTSFAAPWTAGLVGLLLTSEGPLTPAVVEARLEMSASPLEWVESGRIDAAAVLLPPTPPGSADLDVFVPTTRARQVGFTGQFQGDVVQIDLLVDEAVTDTAANPADGRFELTWDASGASAGEHTVQVETRGSSGTTVRSPAVVLEVIEGTGFSDTVSHAFYEDGVIWMVDHGLTTGTTPSTFSPDEPITRGQIATFLWRYAGQPASVSSAGFTDTVSGAFYDDAVGWMVAQGLTTGTTPSTFSPDDPVTRGQLAAFLHRFSGLASVTSESAFTDVARTAFYATAVDYLVEQAITTGTTPSTFSPDSAVTRGQAAAFLWRFAGQPVV